MLDIFESPNYNRVFKVCFWLYILFAAILIYRSSFVAIDGQRHFALFDDAMISMRYANNLIHGRGLVWNVGERVEGFTNPLMVFIMAGALLLFGSNYSILFIQLIGLVCLAFNVLLAYKIISRLLAEDKTDFLVFLTLILTMAWYPIIYWSVFGMETGFLTTLVLLAVYLALYNKPASRINSLLAIILSLIYLARPEGALFIGIFFVFRFLRKWSEKNGFWAVAAEAVICALPILAYQIFRLHYYGQAYPNTYILKATGMAISDRIKNGIAFYKPFLERSALMLFTTVFFFFVYLFEAGSGLKEKIYNLLIGKYSYLVFFITVFFAYGVYQILVGGDPWPPYLRMAVPYTTLFFMAFILTAVKLKKSFNFRTDLFYATLSFIVFAFLIFVPLDYHNDFLRLEPYQTLDNQANFNTALVISQLTTPKATITSFWGGLIPYVTGLYDYDPLGKTDPYIARLPADVSGAISSHGMYSLPGHNKYDLNYTLKQKKPDVIVYLPFNGHYCAWGTQDLQDWCSQNYVLASYKGIEVLLKKNSPNIYWDKIKLLPL